MRGLQFQKKHLLRIHFGFCLDLDWSWFVLNDRSDIESPSLRLCFLIPKIGKTNVSCFILLFALSGSGLIQVVFLTWPWNSQITVQAFNNLIVIVVQK